MPFFAGVDIGSLCTKAVILNSDKNIEAYSIIRSGSVYQGAAEEALNKALSLGRLQQDDLSCLISTGYGRAQVPFADGQVTEISCHGRGANFVFPEARVVIDIGGQDSKVIEIAENGQAVKFVMNDKCAAGTGRFLEVMAGSLDADLDEMSELAAQSKADVEISSVCTVFAESEVISNIHQGVPKEEIVAGIHEAVGDRAVESLNRGGIVEDRGFTGGVAKNIGVVRALENRLGLNVKVPEDPQIAGALGAALIAQKAFPPP